MMEKNTLGTRISNIFLLFLVLGLILFLSAVLAYVLINAPLDNILSIGTTGLLLFAIFILSLGIIEIKSDIIELKRQGVW